MTTQTTERNLPALAGISEIAWAAEIRLARLERCKAIRPFQAGDETLVCASDGFELVGSPLRHSPDEIRAMRALATDWPK